MDAIFLKLLNMSISAGWLILAAVVLRLLLRKAPKWVSCVLWAIVAVRLVCPVSFESAFSLIPSAETVSPEVVYYAQEPAIDSGVPVINDVLNPIVREHFTPTPGASVNPLSIWAWTAGVIWAAGLTAMLGYALVSYLRIRGKVQESVPLRENIRLCDAVRSPFILGVVRPRIYLPSGMDEKQMDCVLAHERAHLQRGDHLWKPFAYMLLSVYWFHPLVWVAYTLFSRDVELACDEKAVKNMDPDGKKAYCRALLACSMSGKVMLSYPLAFGEGRVKQRVRLVLHYRKPVFWVVAVAVVLCAAVAVCFLTDPESDARAGTGEGQEQPSVDHVPQDLYELSGYGRELDMPVTTEDASSEKEQEGIVTFNGIIVENTMDSLVPLIMVQPTGDEIPYNYVCFELPDGEADWADQINSAVTITCKDAFEETQPPYGELISISRAESETDLQAMFDTFRITIHLPENGSWIQNREYRQPDENTMEISYYDRIANADCKLFAVKEGSLKLPETAYEASLEETWGGYTGSGEYVEVRVQRTADGRQVLATWAYGAYQFAILADMLWEDASEADIGPIPKTALAVISNL